MKYFSRNECAVTGETNIRHRRSLSSKMINQLAKIYNGLKFISKKAIEKSNKRPVFAKPKEHETNKEDVKHSFIHYVSKNMMSKGFFTKIKDKNCKY